MSDPTPGRRPPVPFAWVVGALVLLALGGAAWAAGRVASAPADAGQTAVAGADPSATPTPPSPDPSGRATGSPTPCPCPKASPIRTKNASPGSRPSPKPGTKEAEASQPTGRLLVAPGRSRVAGSGPVVRFLVEVEEGLGIRPAAFAARVESVLFDRRSWIGSGVALQRVGSGSVRFRVTLASPATTDRLCAPLQTNGIFSCFMQGRSVLNSWRWAQGSDVYAGDVASYRIYMVNHEVGHALGHGHRDCPGAGLPAPVMQQQTKGLFGCARNPWPTPGELG